jgi:ABC-type uncharacterized transport system permease subunit
MTEKSQPRERSRLGLTPSVVPAAVFPLMIVFIGFLATSVRLMLLTIGAMFIALMLGFIFPRSNPYWQSRYPASRIVLIVLGVLLACAWLAIGTSHLTHPKIFP